MATTTGAYELTPHPRKTRTQSRSNCFFILVPPITQLRNTSTFQPTGGHLIHNINCIWVAMCSLQQFLMIMSKFVAPHHHRRFFVVPLTKIFFPSSHTSLGQTIMDTAHHKMSSTYIFLVVLFFIMLLSTQAKNFKPQQVCFWSSSYLPTILAIVITPLPT